MNQSSVRRWCAALPATFILFCLTALSAAGAVAQKEASISDYGAVGDRKTLNTAFIQKAIDEIHAAGGGRVIVPEGVFISGSLFLKTGVELHLIKGAVLLGSNKIEDYPVRETRIEGHFEPWRMALINAEGLKSVRITGQGKIDGNGLVFWAAFWQRRKENPKCTNLEVERPRLMFIDRCTDVKIEGLTLRDSGFWHVHLYRCQDVTIEGLDISSLNSYMRAPSTDGIDIDSCQNVTVRRCRIAVDDDCIALKGSKGPLADQDTDSPPVENILVEDCEFGQGHGVLTCGSEATVVRNVTVRNCSVTGKVILLCLKLRPDTPQLYENILMESITLASKEGRFLDVKPWMQFFDLKGHQPRASIVRNVTLRNITGNYGILGTLRGNDLDKISDFTLENINITVLDPSFSLGPVSGLHIKNVQVNGKPFAPKETPNDSRSRGESAKQKLNPAQG